ncbi:MAG: choice-of-anchor tandem repeat GloVer-containing protein [Rhizomicrobium sp.]|jgi:uncharacterized repeat protein (TIGR03803 family)
MPVVSRQKSLGLTAVIALASTLMTSAFAPALSGERVLHKFQGGSDGATPSGGLIAGSKGHLYGTTDAGGGGVDCSNGGGGCGVIFQVASRGEEKILYAFKGGSDGAFPYGSLLLDNSGNLYGTTEGGAGTGCNGYGCGTVFKLAPDGTESLLYAFQGGSDGYIPLGNLIADANGNLYGLTDEGGNYTGTECTRNDTGCGTVFEVQPNGTKITLYAFQGGSDGAFPLGGLVADTSGNLYGTTGSGGADDLGTVFKLASDGTESVLYAFQGGTDGEGPRGGVIIDGAGNLYGTTFDGGTQGAGTVFKITPGGSESVLYSFQGGKSGANPDAGLVMDADGNLYGTAYDGGNSKCIKNGVVGCGIVFELTANGEEKVLCTFNKSRGENPAAPLLLSGRNELYGTTTTGNGNYGVVFGVKAK